MYRKKRLTPYLDRWRYKIQSAGIRQSAGRHGQHVRLVTDGMDKIQPINDKGQACNAYIAARLSTKQTWEHGRGSNWLLLYRQQPRRCFIFQLTTFARNARKKGGGGDRVRDNTRRRRTSIGRVTDMRNCTTMAIFSSSCSSFAGKRLSCRRNRQPRVLNSLTADRRAVTRGSDSSLPPSCPASS